MGINIFGIEPSVISRDLSGKSFLIYGTRKSGKTSTAVKFPKPIIIGFEKGWSMLSGVKGQPINKWSEALTVKKQLINDANKVLDGKKSETFYKTVIVDTADIGYDMCESFILSKEGVDYLDETESKRGYRAVSKEFDSFFQEIVKAGYTLIAISHSTTTQVKENGQKYDKTQPALPNRGMLVLSRLVDIIAFASPETDEEGNTKMYLTMRGNKELEAGSRNKYTSEKIPFTYEALLKDMKQAIDRLEAEGAKISDEPITVYEDQTEDLNAEEAILKINEIEEVFNILKISKKCVSIVNKYLGKGKSVDDCDETHSELLSLILDDLNDIISNENINIQEVLTENLINKIKEQGESLYESTGSHDVYLKVAKDKLGEGVKASESSVEDHDKLIELFEALNVELDKLD